MRFGFAALLLPLVAACGSSEPASVEFDRPASAVNAALAAVDGRVDMEGLLKSPIVARKRGADEALVFVLGHDGAANRGQISFRVEPLGESRSRVFVDAQVPEIKSTIGGQAKFLSESKIESLLTERVAALAKRMGGGGEPTAELDSIDQAIAFTALALDPKEVNRALDLAGNDDELAAAIEREADWGSDDASDEAGAGSTMDRAGGNDTWGDDTTGDAAAGEEPVADDGAGFDE